MNISYRNWAFPFLFLILTSWGCAHQYDKAPVLEKKISLPGPILQEDVVNDRISRLTDLMKHGDLSPEEIDMVHTLLDAYEGTFSAISRGSGGEEENRRLIQVLFKNLVELEERYFFKREPDKRQLAQVISRISAGRKKIHRAYVSGDYRGVIKAYQDLEAALGPDVLTPEIKLLFSLSLARQGKLKEATRIGEKTVREMDKLPDINYLMADMIQWHHDLGNHGDASYAYDRLTDKRDEMEELLRISKKKISPEAEEKADNMEPSSEVSLAGKETQEDDLEKVLKEVEILLQRNAFQDAKLLLIRERIRAEEEPALETIDQVLKTVQLAEEQYLSGATDSVFVREDTLKGKSEAGLTTAINEEVLSAAKNLIQEEKFEEALNKLGELKYEGEMPRETKDLRVLATDKLINRERDKAAKIFLLAKKTNDTLKKKELLLSSYKILNDLLYKYPSSNLNQRIKDNIVVVKQELSKLGIDPG